MNLKFYLFNENLTQTEFAKRIGYTREYVSAISRGKIIAGKKVAREIEKATNGAVTFDELREKQINEGHNTAA